MNHQLFTDVYVFHLECLFEACIDEFRNMNSDVTHDFIETESGMQLIVRVKGNEIYNNSIAFKSKRRMMETFIFDGIRKFNK